MKGEQEREQKRDGTRGTAEKRWWKTFLTPGWIIAAILIALFSYYAFTFLAPWQLGKNEALEQRNEHISEAFDHDPVPLSNLLGADGTISQDSEWARVTATGHYLDRTVLLRLRPVDRNPAFQVLTPFALDNGPTILINRGWVPAENSTQVPDIAPAPTGDVTLEAMLLAGEPTHSKAPMQDQGYDMVYSIAPAQVGELTGTELVAPYLQLLSGQPGELTAIPLPVLETGNHLSYGLQWIAFGIMAPAGLIYFIVAETRERRRFREEQEQMLLDAPASGPGPDPESADGEGEGGVEKHAPMPPAPARSRARYGDGRRNPWQRAYDRQEER